MAKIRTLKCPVCEGTFDYMQHPSTDAPYPKFCPLCGIDPSSDEDGFAKEITAPHIAKSIGKAGDATYRGMEVAAEERIQEAARLTGQPESDFKDMKITNLKDNLRAGDTADIAPPPNEVSTMIRENPNVFGFQGGSPIGGMPGNPTPAAMAAAAHTGADAYAGLQARTMLKQHHQAMSGAATTETPALEVVQRDAMRNSGPGRRR